MTAQPKGNMAGKLRVSKVAGRVFIYACLTILAAAFLAPLVSMLFTSLKGMEEIRSGNLLSVPMAPTVEAWKTVWNAACIGVTCTGLKGYFGNSFLIVIPATLLSVGLGALNGYVFANWRFKGDNVLFGLILFGCFIPFQIVLIPMAGLLGTFNLAGTISGLVLVHVIYGVCFTTMFFRNYFVTVPAEIFKAARIDGAGFWAVFFRILLPISWPIVMVSIIWQFTGIWNDFLFGVSFAAGSNQPVTVALNNLVNTSTGTKAYNEDMAAAMIAALPTILIYVAAGRYFLRGLMAGAVKG
ncbi:glucose/mannose transport system permease protein [Rhizobium skierniewicense]|uniref:Glucose/mannose transport system permease protein n=2 Tax=Rhizobium skierniewicense TaxID=984260 RepID=A0A7W6CBA0_9HYPH|nr:carbohydrate ABC transporter permease [Rhizobium skierniewicense]MBB3945375.1 glucose/mannose transport system permease protein [Rhizobium skierniewicense]NTF33919.1 carbohydrate ABC transporter permease [Rhizobium skierniewicense]